MDIWNKDNTLEITCVDDSDSNKQLILYYEIVSTTVANRWIELINKNNKVKNKIKFNYRKILSFKEVEKQFVEFQENIKFINSTDYDVKLPDIISVNHLRINPGLLNDLHEQFEVYGDRLEANFKENIKLPKINLCIGKINNFYDVKLKPLYKVDKTEIDNLHNEYLNYLDRVQKKLDENWWDNAYLKIKDNDPLAIKWPGIKFNKDIHEAFIELGKLIEPDHDMFLHEAFLKLNEQIHNFEAVFRTWDNTDKSICTCLVDFMPNKPLDEIVPSDYLHEQLNPEDFILFTPEHKWGWLYLGYNTLGKHWSSACHDDDIEVVKRKQIRPQQRFAAEMYMNFRPSVSYYSCIALHKWWTTNNFSEFIDPELRLRDLALGFIPVARLQSYALNNNPIISSNAIIDQEDWNLNVWSKFNSIKSARVIKK
jgi:hypothetical protein